MSSERRSIEGELQDGVADREEGYTHNPNPEEEIAAQRARFEEMQRKLQADRSVAAEAVTEVQQKLGEQYQEAQNDPQHQEFIAEQLAHGEIDQPYMRGGQEIPGDEVVTTALPQNAEIGQRRPLPTTAREAEEFNNEGG
jgi:hypothetical protein